MFLGSCVVTLGALLLSFFPTDMKSDKNDLNHPFLLFCDAYCGREKAILSHLCERETYYIHFRVYKAIHK